MYVATTYVRQPHTHTHTHTKHTNTDTYIYPSFPKDGFRVNKLIDQHARYSDSPSPNLFILSVYMLHTSAGAPVKSAIPLIPDSSSLIQLSNRVSSCSPGELFTSASPSVKERKRGTTRKNLICTAG